MKEMSIFPSKHDIRENQIERNQKRVLRYMPVQRTASIPYLAILFWKQTLNP